MAGCRFTAARSASRPRSCCSPGHAAVPIFAFSDIICAAIPIGLFFGRIANFINGELFGRVTDVPWAMVFPGGGPLPRHPSQLYEASCEGILLFVLLFAAERSGRAAASGYRSAACFSPATPWRGCRASCSANPTCSSAFIPIFGFDATMGQLLSLPLLVAGIVLILWARRQPIAAAGSP